MLCPTCGAQVKDGAKFCESCGARLSPASVLPETQLPPTPWTGEAPKPAAEEQKISKNITLCADGKYRWVYHMNLLKNPTIFLLVWKIFFFILLGIAAFGMILQAFTWSDYFPDRFLTDLKFWGIFFLGMTALVIVSYLVYAAVMGGKYSVMFEMDEKGINHKQMPAQAKKAKKIAVATVLVGLAGGRLSTVGAGIGASRTDMYSAFDRVRKVKAYPRRSLIKINERLEHNQVYAAPEDFDFVKNYILSHCDHLK